MELRKDAKIRSLAFFVRRLKSEMRNRKLSERGEELMWEADERIWKQEKGEFQKFLLGLDEEVDSPSWVWGDG
jgi:hypothetical protein